MAGENINEIRRAISPQYFVKGDRFENLYRDMTVGRAADTPRMPFLIVLTGRSGVGKTEAGLQLIQKFKESADKTCLECRIPSSRTSNDLAANLRKLANDLDLHLPAFENEPTSNLHTIFTQLFDKINEKYPIHVKLFLFDDGEPKTSLLELIDSTICQKLVNGKADPQLWKLIVTTQRGRENTREWLERCRYISDDCFKSITPFAERESLEYLQGLQNLEENEKKRLHEKMGGLPLALKIARLYFEEIVLHTGGTELLEEYFKSLDDMEAPNDAIASIKHSVRRLIESIEYPEVAEVVLQVIKMISLLDEKNITSDIVISCTEVAIVVANGRVNGRTQAKDLANTLIKGLKTRALCETSTGSEQLITVNLFELVKLSISLFRADDSDEETRKLLRMTLVALTRLMPKDGRSHYSHTFLSYMHKHAENLHHVVRAFKAEGKLSRDNAPCVMMLHANLLSCMAYCQLAQRNSYHEDVKPLIDQALDEYSLALAGEKYEELIIEQNQNGNHIDERRAELLVDATRAPDTIQRFIDNPNYRDFVIKHLSSYHRLTAKDISNISEIGAAKRHPRAYMECGHLTEAGHQLLLREKKILPQASLAKIYPLEILAEIYDVQARVYRFQGDDDLKGVSLAGARAGLSVCRMVNEHYDVSLLIKVIIERDCVLELELEMAVRDTLEIQTDYQRLQALEVKCYEYGITRTDLANDEYHKFVCKEAVATCKGILYKQTQNQIHQEEGSRIFDELLDESRRFGSSQTQSKTHKKYAAFLNTCENFTGAIKHILYAMYYLNAFLRRKAARPEFPEQQPNCGKFKALYKMLKKYYEAWLAGRHDNSTVLRRSEDDLLIKYVDDFTSHYHSNISPDNVTESPFQTIADLIPPPEAVAMEQSVTAAERPDHPAEPLIRLVIAQQPTD